MFLVVSYDIADDRRRSRVAKLMEYFGRRVQYSVFDCILDEGKLQKLKRGLLKVIDPKEDSIRVYRLCQRDRESIEVIGRGTVREDEDVVVL